MANQPADYEAICDAEMAAADRAKSEEARVAHLERALRHALLAAEARKRGQPADFRLWQRNRAQKKRKDA